MHKHAIQNKIGVFRVFEKVNTQKGKNSILLSPGLRYTHKKLNFASNKIFLKNVCLSTHFDLRLKRKLGQFLKNISHTISIFGNCMISKFFDKKFFFFYFVQYNFMPKQEKSSSKIRWHHFSKMYEIFMTSIFS